jgi:hypothetical protein
LTSRILPAPNRHLLKQSYPVQLEAIELLTFLQFLAFLFPKAVVELACPSILVLFSDLLAAIAF